MRQETQKRRFETIRSGVFVINTKARFSKRRRLMAMRTTTAGAAGTRSAAVGTARRRRSVGAGRSGRAHQTRNLFCPALRAGRFRRRENERFENRVATLALVFVNRHWNFLSEENERVRPTSASVSGKSGTKKRRLERSVAGSPSRRFVKVGVRRERSALSVRSSGQTTCGTTTVDGRAARTGLFASRR